MGEASKIASESNDRIIVDVCIKSCGSREEGALSHLGRFQKGFPKNMIKQGLEG